jgi:hypothetical protein
VYRNFNMNEGRVTGRKGLASSMALVRGVLINKKDILFHYSAVVAFAEVNHR